jgi:hypothetical protein
MKTLYLLILVLAISGVPKAFASGIDISDSPMETKVQSAPPLIMFVIDDSGSMDWEVMTSEDEGLFSNQYYVFPQTDPNSYLGKILSGTDRLKWKSQWSGYNKIFYNPHSTYRPWPGKSAASKTAPRGNPHGTSETQTLTLNNEYASVKAGIVHLVVVDNNNSNNEPGNSYTESGSWSNSGSSNMYLGSARFTDSSGSRATWSLNVPKSDNYNVYAWWNCFNNRDQKALYRINHASGSDAVQVNQRQESGNVCGEWVQIGGPYVFNAGSGHSISVERNVSAGSNGSSTVADAVRIFPASASGTPETISIKNSHYYTSDTDGTVYLVNIDPINETRSYYRLNDLNGNDRVDDGELTLVPDADVPNTIKKAKRDEEGNIIGYFTAEEDLQNFANWYSFYRRRETTAKAAIAQSITKMAGVKAGLYTIHQRVVQPVLPIKLDVAGSDQIVIVDDSSGGAYSQTTGWSNTTSATAYSGSARRTGTGSSSATATWTLNIPAADSYNVFAWWYCSSGADKNARYSINHAAGTSTVNVNQRDESGNKCGEWVKIAGPFDFNAGPTQISVARHSGSTSGSRTLADAVKLESTTISYEHIDQTDTLLNQVYSMNSSDGTPLRLALKEVGMYYAGDSGKLGPSPYASKEEGGGCQKAYAIVMTDGFWNGNTPSVGNVDGESSAYSGMAPYSDSYSNTLADVAMKYYKEDLSTELSNIAPTNSCDSATHQHMNTYTVSFGVTGTLDPNDLDGDGIPGPFYKDDPCFLNSATPRPTWPNPTSGDKQKIDDLWHAAVNGRGLFFSAQDPDELVAALTEIVEDIALPASGASVSVNSNELQEGLAVYQTRYVSGEWSGDVVAFPVNAYSGALLTNEADILWRARNKVPAPSSRKIATYNGSTGVRFGYSYLSTAQQGKLLFSGETDTALAAARVDYLRGETSGVIDHGFRYREFLLGDVVHSAPVVSPTGKTLYFGANDGMLHAIDTETGQERFAYVPNLVFDNLKNLTRPDYVHQFFVDLTPTVKALTPKKTLLVGGLGKGGKGLFALNLYEENSSGTVLVDAESAALTEAHVADSIVAWEYSAEVAGDADLGFTFSKPAIVRSNDPNYEWVIIIGNGYDSSSGTAALYVFTLSGTLLKKIDTQISGSNGLSEPAVVDANSDFKADYAYAGDLNGNLWKFDLTSSDFNNWDVAYKNASSQPAPLFRAPGQPITSRPDVMYHCAQHGFLVVFGTGKFLGESDRTNTSIQSLYGIWDYGDDVDDSEYLGHITSRPTGGDATLSSGLKLLRQTIIDERSLDGSQYRTFSNNFPESSGSLWPLIADDTSGQKPNPAFHAGWFVDFDDTYSEGERFIKDIIINDGRAFVLSFIPNSSPCSGGGDSLLYIFNACTGGRLDRPQFTLASIPSGKFDVGGELVAPTGKRFSGMLHVPTFISKPGGKDRVYISSSTGVIEEEDITGERLGMIYWQQLEN